MKKIILTFVLPILMSGCGIFHGKPFGTAVDPTAGGSEDVQADLKKSNVPRQPIAFIQDPRVRNPYTGVMPYVICYGHDCDKPTPKSPAAQARVTPMPSVPATTRREARIRESIEYLYNTTHIAPQSIAVMDSLIKSAQSAKEILITGHAGMTRSNIENERRVLGLALERANDVRSRLKNGQVEADVKIEVELLRCKSESECLQKYKYGGRRSDVEILIIENGEKSGKPQRP